MNIIVKKCLSIIRVLTLSAVFVISCFQQSNFPTLKGPYLGQKPPGNEPELFAPGILTDIYREHSATKFTPDGEEVFWTRVMNQGGSPRLDVIVHVQQRTKKELRRKNRKQKSPR